MPSQTFEDHVLGVVDRFLHTVVVVDDQALEHGESSNDDELVDNGETAPGGRGITTVTEPADEGHDLPAKELINAFAAKGLLCSILDPAGAVGERLRKTAGQADLLVIDWWMNGNRGETALELIEEVLTQDQSPGNRRLRAVAVYTGEPDLLAIADALEEVLDDVYLDSDLLREPDALSMTRGPVRLTVLAKEHVTISDAAIRANRVRVADLPDRLAREFTHLAQGLVSGVALASLGALRQDTHRILEKLEGPSLDPAYLGHRVAQRRPTDAEQHLTEMITQEIGSVLSDMRVGSTADIRAIKLWMKALIASGVTVGANYSFTPPITRQQVERMLKDGLGDDQQLKNQLGSNGRNKTQLQNVRKSATKLFCSDDSERQRSDGVFAERMMLRTTYRKPRRELHLGTVVSRYSQYLVCVQPFCDSIRLGDAETRAFPFLPLFEPTDGKVDFVVYHPERDEWIEFALTKKPSAIKMIEFRGNSEGVVAALKQGKKYRFSSVEGGYRWMGELKPDLAHRVAEEIAHEFSRLGVEEPEILRLSRR